MTKSDLRTGMVVEDENGAVGVVLKNTATVDGIKWFLDSDKDKMDIWEELNIYNEDLTAYGHTANDIIKVYQTSDFDYYTTTKVYDEDNIIWNRYENENISSEFKELTMKDIEKKFGCKVKIVA